MDAIKAIAKAIMQGRGHSPNGMPVNTPATPPQLPPYVQPGAMMDIAYGGALPSAPGAAASGAAPPPKFTPQAPGQAAPPGDLVDAQTQANTQVPPMPDPVNIGAAPGAQQSVRQDLLSAVLASIRNNTLNGQPPAWAQNFGNLTDQQKT